MASTQTLGFIQTVVQYPKILITAVIFMVTLGILSWGVESSRMESKIPNAEHRKRTSEIIGSGIFLVFILAIWTTWLLHDNIKTIRGLRIGVSR